MFSSVIALVLLPLVWGAPDPTKVCAPDVFQFFSYNIETDGSAQIAIDFKQKLLTSASPNQTVVQDFVKLKSYTFDASGNCQSANILPEQFYPQCLPARSTYIGEVFIGFGPNRVPAEAWETPYFGGTLRAAVSHQPGEPRYAVLVKFVNAQGIPFTNFCSNPTLNITVPNAFKIPDPCPPATIG
ncbi:unnamed protein product [Lymnaea stagnalis]|uniref:Uncharacterized protein n=1 Tax=Lymnaea stagnalis TaxID=6523 RepID=A0AAV2IEH6_LYMST